MKISLTTPIASALLAIAFSVTARAETGRPSEAPSDRPTVIVSENDEVGSYARYLMLNGKPRDEAIKIAQNIDHPEPSKLFALRGAKASVDAVPGHSEANGAAASARDWVPEPCATLAPTWSSSRR